MNTKEAIKEIRGRTKPYVEAKMPQSTFSSTLRAIERGLCKPETVKSFMATFGYTPIEQDQEWQKQNN